MKLRAYFMRFKPPLMTLSILLALLCSAVTADTINSAELSSGHNAGNQQQEHIAEITIGLAHANNENWRVVGNVMKSRDSLDNKLTEGMTLIQVSDHNFSISPSKNETVLYLEGSLDIGIISALENSLLQYPGTTGIILKSEGGNVYQARGLARIIKKNSLNTYTFDNCFSACTIVFIAGSKRYVGENGKLGFHSYYLTSNYAAPQLNIEKEQKKDMIYFSDQISDTTFIGNMFRIESPDLWLPSVNRLLQAGVAHQLIAEF